MKKHPVQTVLAVAATFLTTFNPALAAESAATVDRYDYPELQVTPSASERLMKEAEAELDNRWTNLLSLELAGLTTLAASFVNRTAIAADFAKNPNGLAAADYGSANLGMIIGAGTLVTGLGFSFLYKPYRSAAVKLKKMPAGSDREKLSRERFAEEELMSTGSFGNKLAWIGFGLNFLASGYMLANAKNDSLSLGMSAVALGTSLLPLIFSSNWESTADQHLENKKRIFRPVAHVGMAPLLTAKRDLLPGLVLSLQL